MAIAVRRFLRAGYRAFVEDLPDEHRHEFKHRVVDFPPADECCAGPPVFGRAANPSDTVHGIASLTFINGGKEPK